LQNSFPDLRNKRTGNAVMKNFTTRRLEEEITQWFHSMRYYDTIAPIDAVTMLCDEFFEFVKQQELPLIGSEDRIWQSMCEATCTLRKAYLHTSPRIITKKYYSFRPKDWKEEYEVYWKAILEYLFSMEVLESFVKCIPKGTWEETVRDWRGTIVMFLPEYIQPSLEVLERFGYIAREKEEWIICDDEESTAIDAGV